MNVAECRVVERTKWNRALEYNTGMDTNGALDIDTLSDCGIMCSEFG